MRESELESIEAYCKYLTEQTGVEATFEYLQPTHVGKRPDFIIKPHNYLVEIKQIQDFNEVKQSAAWGGTITRLHKIIDGHSLLSKIGGHYLVDTPYPFQLPQNHDTNYELVTELLGQIAKNDKKKFNVKIENYVFKITRFSDEGNSISFSWDRPGNSVNAPGTVNRNIFGKLIEADRQLAFNPDDITVEKRIILLSRQYFFARKRDVIQALSFSLDTLYTLSNTDEIWLQQPPYDVDSYLHDIVFSKSFAMEINEENILPDNYELFENWFWSLKELGDEFKQKLAHILIKLFENNEPYKLFKDTYAREEMVGIATWLAENKDYESAVKLADVFINDPDPSVNPNAKDPERDYDKEVREGKDTIIITTVLGHLAWTVQKLTIEKPTFKKSFELTLQLANHPNLYVKLQSLVPLIEITKRREWLKEIDAKDGTQFFETFKSLVFTYLKEYSKFRSIRDWLVHVFFNFRDLNTQEVVEVLDKLKEAENASALYVYFGIYRKNHFKERTDLEFDAEKIEAIFKNAIINYKDNQNLAGGIAWQLGKIFRDNTDELNVVKPWIEFILEQPFDKQMYDDVQIILDDVYNVDPELAIKWTKIIIDKASEYAESQNDIRVANSMWLMLEDKLEWIAKYEPENLLEYMNKIVLLWKHGAYVGHFQTWLTTYKFIEEDKLRGQVKTEAKKIFAEMKSINPTILDYEWPE